jgi:hypothetical protein
MYFVYMHENRTMKRGVIILRRGGGGMRENDEEDDCKAHV